VYDLAQALNGAHHTNPFLIEQFGRVPDNAFVLDVGGGTGRISELWPKPLRYVCAGPDPDKLRRFREKSADGRAVVANGGHLPIRDRSVDAVVCVAISHHLPEDVLLKTVSEVSRVVKDDGTLIFYDAVWAPKRGAGRLLWKYEQGSFPRSPRVLDAEFDRLHRDASPTGIRSICSTHPSSRTSRPTTIRPASAACSSSGVSPFSWTGKLLGRVGRGGAAVRTRRG